jgi:hypothetical protein
MYDEMGSTLESTPCSYASYAPYLVRSHSIFLTVASSLRSLHTSKPPQSFQIILVFDPPGSSLSTLANVRLPRTQIRDALLICGRETNMKMGRSRQGQFTLEFNARIHALIHF